MDNIIQGKVAKIIDENKIVLNKGYASGIKMGMEFQVYYNDEEIFDPDSGKSLGFLEILCGIGKPEHIQEHMTTIIPARVHQVDFESQGLLGVSTKTKRLPKPFEHTGEQNLLFKVI